MFANDVGILSQDVILVQEEREEIIRCEMRDDRCTTSSSRATS